MGDCADADARSAAVNAECCGDADCSSGAPDTCDAACARLLLPFVEDCLGLGSGHRRAQSSPFDGIIAECRAVMPAPRSECGGKEGSAGHCYRCCCGNCYYMYTS